MYVADKTCHDLLVIGRNDVECRNGERFSQEYAQNFLLQRQETGQLLIRKFQAFVVSTMGTAAEVKIHPDLQDFSSLKAALSRPSKGAKA